MNPDTSFSPYCGQMRWYAVAELDASFIQMGDAVQLAGSAAPNGMPYVTRSNGTSKAVGVAVGVGSKEYNGSIPLDTQNLYGDVGKPANNAEIMYVSVVDDPHMFYRMAENPGGTALDETHVGLYTQIHVTDAGYRDSGMRVPNLTDFVPTADDTLPLKLERRLVGADGSVTWLVALTH